MTGNAGMLPALPAHSLTHLKLSQLPRPFDSAAVSAALARLSNLQQLQLGDAVMFKSTLANVAQLTCLTLLEVEGYCPVDELVQLLLAQPLPLRVLRMPGFSSAFSLDLSHLSQLQELSIGGMVMPTAVFPSQMQRLEVGWVQEQEALESILQLQRLSFMVAVSKSELLRLTELPALQLLKLWYAIDDAGEEAAATAAAWPLLPQLHELVLHFWETVLSRQQWEAVRGGLAACTNLTKLEMNGFECPASEQAQGLEQDMVVFEKVNVCYILAALTNLKDLSISHSQLGPGEALALTALTGLTRLVLTDVGAGVNDLAATVIASSCQQLQHLELCDCALDGMACLAAVRNLTQLTTLRLDRNNGLTQQGLMLLTGLKRLQELHVARNAEVTDEVVKSFWAALRQ